MERVPQIATTKRDNIYVYRFRAEYEPDVNQIQSILGNRVTKFIRIHEYGEADHEVEVYGNITLEELREAMREVEDGYVMVQTVAPADQYTGERDYTIK